MGLERHKRLAPRWQTWRTLVPQCRQLAQNMLLAKEDSA